MTPVQPESWFVWYLLGSARERTAHVARMAEALPSLAEPVPRTPHLSERAVSVLGSEVARRLGTSLVRDLGDREYWFVGEDGTTREVSVRGASALAARVRLGADLWALMWATWGEAIGAWGPDVVGTIEREAWTDACAEYLFGFAGAARARWWLADVGALEGSWHGAVPRRSSLESFADSSTWDMPTRVAAIRAWGRDEHLRPQLLAAVREWSGARALGYDDADIIRRLARQEGLL